MKIICSYCKKETGEKEPFDDDSVSHSICSECFDYFEEQIKGLSLERYLDKFKAPIIIVDADGRILASNKMAEKMTGKSRREIFGLLGGEAMECAYARLPEGCGKTVHCETCTIRRTVMKTMDSGEPQLHTHVTLAGFGEPWVSFFNPNSLIINLKSIGFTQIEGIGPKEINDRFFNDRADKLLVGNFGHLMKAQL